jgi:hypothetical protein
MDNYFRFEPDGDATNFVVESDWEMPGKVPGFIKDMVSKGWVERNFRNSMADCKALVEAKAPAHITRNVNELMTRHTRPSSKPPPPS